jgi:hypothetical protein
MKIRTIKTELTPGDLYMSDVEFNNLVFQAEQNWLTKYENSKTKESCVQYWIKVSSEKVNPIHIKQLKDSYKEAGWDNVEVTWVNDRTTSLMVCLSMNN